MRKAELKMCYPVFEAVFIIEVNGKLGWACLSKKANSNSVKIEELTISTLNFLKDDTFPSIFL